MNRPSIKPEQDTRKSGPQHGNTTPESGPRWDSELTYPSSSNPDILTAITGGSVESFLRDAGFRTTYVTDLKQELACAFSVPEIQPLLLERAHYQGILNSPHMHEVGMRIQALGYLYGLSQMRKHDVALVQNLSREHLMMLGPKAVVDALTHFATTVLFDAEHVQPMVAALLFYESKAQTSLNEKMLLTGILEPIRIGLEKYTDSHWSKALYLPRLRAHFLDPFLPRTPTAARSIIDTAVKKIVDSTLTQTIAERFNRHGSDHPALAPLLSTRPQKALLSALEVFLQNSPVITDRDAKMIISELAPPCNWGVIKTQVNDEEFQKRCGGQAHALINECSGGNWARDDFEPLDRAVILMTLAQVGFVHNPSEFSVTHDKAQALLSQTYGWESKKEKYRIDVAHTLRKCFERALDT